MKRSVFAAVAACMGICSGAFAQSNQAKPVETSWLSLPYEAEIALAHQVAKHIKAIEISENLLFSREGIELINSILARGSADVPLFVWRHEKILVDALVENPTARKVLDDILAYLHVDLEDATIKEAGDRLKQEIRCVRERKAPCVMKLTEPKLNALAEGLFAASHLQKTFGRETYRELFLTLSELSLKALDRVEASTKAQLKK